VFIEQSVDSLIGDRISRFWAAYDDSTAWLPLVIVDSGHRFTTGDQPNYVTAYSYLVRTELARPPQAEIDAYVRRVGDQMRIYASARNDSTATLSSADNHAALTALVYEDKHAGTTGRIMRAAPTVGITPVVTPGGVFSATLNTPTLSGVGWANLHTVVVVDCVPGPGPAFDMLQAAVARPPELSATPNTVSAAIDSGSPKDAHITVRLRGPYTLTWTASADVPWLGVAPPAGAISVQPSLVVSASGLAAGSQQGTVTFSAASGDDMSFVQAVDVTALLGPREVEIGDATGVTGATISLPVTLSALGDETSLGFSISFDPTVLSYVETAPGNDVGSTNLHADESQAASGRIGVSITLPEGETFAPGDRQLAVVEFTVAAVASAGSAAVAFSDQPVPRAVLNLAGNALTAAYGDAAVTIALAPRTARRHLLGGAP
jgi:hypothetical protein